MADDEQWRWTVSGSKDMRGLNSSGMGNRLGLTFRVKAHRTHRCVQVAQVVCGFMDVRSPQDVGSLRVKKANGHRNKR